jgi:CTP synthase (UTP-ammonia lyase)
VAETGLRAVYRWGMRVVALGDRDPGFLTRREIDATLELIAEEIEFSWVATDSAAARDLDGVDGIWLLPGTPYRDDDAAYDAIRHCLKQGTPFLGTCGGFQYACVELARALAGVTGAAHAESDSDGEELVIVPLACSLYGELRTVRPVGGTRLASICGAEPFEGFHFCGYGLATEHAERLAAAGVILSASAVDAGTEAIELRDHPFFVATAFQPQVGSSQSGELHPLISAFLETAAKPAAAPGVPLADQRHPVSAHRRL